MTDTSTIKTHSAHTSQIQVKSRYSLAFDDICDGFKNWRLSLFLSWHDVKLQYRRSALGPLWITLSISITIFSMGFLYGKLFKMDLKVYFPFLAAGILAWNLILTLVLEGMNTFVDAESFIKQMKQPYFIFILKVTNKAFIIFFHNIVVLPPLMIFTSLKFTTASLFLIVSLILLWLNSISYSMILSLLSTRFRDLKPIVTNLMQVVFFITPVMWMPDLMPNRFHFAVDLNPFAQFLEMIRAPLLGRMPSVYSIEVVLFITVFGLSSAFLLFSFYRARIAYWL